MFWQEAFRLGLRLARGALRHDGLATWLGDDFARRGPFWRPALRTLEGDLASGTAGVGFFLSRVAAVAGEPSVGPVAAEALRHSLSHGEDLIAAGRFGWYDGTLGIAWAAMEGGRALDLPQLEEDGARLARRTAAALPSQADDGDPAGLLGRSVGIVAGLLAVTPQTVDGGLRPAGRERARRLAESFRTGRSRIAGGGSGKAPPIGLSRGCSGLGLAMASWHASGGGALAREVGLEAFRIERAWFEPGQGWRSPRLHPWRTRGHEFDQSWCAGAAGIGIARVAGHVAFKDLLSLAEAGAAIELVRRGLAGIGGGDASLCHGAAGGVELLLIAGSALNEPAHTAAARRAGRVLVERARASGEYGSGLGPNARNPSLLLGLAGTGLTLLRLHDPELAPSAALPPLFHPRGNTGPGGEKVP